MRAHVGVIIYNLLFLSFFTWQLPWKPTSPSSLPPFKPPTNTPQPKQFRSESGEDLGSLSGAISGNFIDASDDEMGSPSLTRTPTLPGPGGLAGASSVPMGAGGAQGAGGGGAGGMVVVGEAAVLEDGTVDDGSVPSGPVKSTTMCVGGLWLTLGVNVVKGGTDRPTDRPWSCTRSPTTLLTNPKTNTQTQGPLLLPAHQVLRRARQEQQWRLRHAAPARRARRTARHGRVRGHGSVVAECRGGLRACVGGGVGSLIFRVLFRVVVFFFGFCIVGGVLGFGGEEGQTNRRLVSAAERERLGGRLETPGVQITGAREEREGFNSSNFWLALWYHFCKGEREGCKRERDGEGRVGSTRELGAIVACIFQSS